MDKASIWLWDESRLAINAIEMSENNNFWVTYFDGEPDMWNTKPPLLICLQTILIKLLGIHPYAIRIPVTIADFLTSLYLLRFIKKYTNSYAFGFFTCLCW